MNKRLKVLLPAIIIIVVCAVATVVACCLLLNKGDDNGFHHLEVSGGGSEKEDFNVSLFRVNLDSKTVEEDEGLVSGNDSDRADFTTANDKNIFGLTGDSVIIPGCMYSADMVIENGSSQGAIAYWLNIVVTQGSILGDQLKFTVTADGEEVVSDYLNGTIAVGSELNALAVVPAGSSSEFTVKIEFVRGGENNAVQGEFLYFDLVVKAAFVG